MSIRHSPVCFLVLLFLFNCGCTSLSIDRIIEINESEDWLMIGSNPEKTNLSKSKSRLQPPFELYWTYDVDAGLNKNSISASDAIVFANTLNAEVFAIDMISGKSLGRFSTTSESSFSVPVIFGNNVITTSSGGKGNSIFSYNLIKGEVRWERNIRWVESSPVLLDEYLYVSTVNGNIYKLKASDGKVIWKSGLKNRLASFYTSPTVSNGKLFIGSTDGTMYAFEINHGKGMWKFNAGAPIFSDVSVNDGRLYFGCDNNFFYCLDTAGNKIWEKNLNSKFQSSSAFYKGNVITSCVDGNVHSLDRMDGSIVWSFETKGAVTASPVLHGDLIFIGSYDKFFYCLNAADGKELWKYLCEGRVKTSAVIWKDFIFTGSDDKYLYCFK